MTKPKRGPLPPELGLFDEDGHPHTVQRRASVEALRDWVSDPDRVLEWTFPGGALDAETRARFRGEIETLNGQPWGATAYLDAVLADWPVDQAEMDVSVEAAERGLVEALAAAEATPEPGPPPTGRGSGKGPRTRRGRVRPTVSVDERPPEDSPR